MENNFQPVAWDRSFWASWRGVVTDLYTLLYYPLVLAFPIQDTFPEWLGKTNAIFGVICLFVAEINIYQLRVGFISLHEWIPSELQLWKELKIQK